MLFLISVLVIASLCGQEIPRPEYPQPQFQRQDWLNLNGYWEFEFDDTNKGLEENWAVGNHGFTRQILVPFCFESKRSGIGDTSFHPWIWYRRSFTIPDSWKGKRILLHFSAVDYRALVWVNGHLVGGHEGGTVPFFFDITAELKPGPNVLTVRAEDPPTDRDIPRGKQYWEPQSRGIFYTRTSGIWQTVWLEAVGESYLRKVRITPSNDGIVRFEVLIDGLQSGLELSVEIRFGNRRVANCTATVSDSRAKAVAWVNAPRLWTADSPNLYDLTFVLRHGDVVVDRVESYFGFRTVEAAGGRVQINGRSVFLKMVLDQGYWPDTILTPPSDEAIQYDIRMAKQMGFNGARKHQKVEDPRYLYWADRMGFYVSGEMANAYQFSDDYVIRFVKEWAAVVERDLNHPSIIIWAPINESWGVPDLRDPRQQNHLKSLYALTKSLDATRLVIDNEGWEHLDTTDLFAIHDYAPRGERLFAIYRDLGKSGPPPRSGRPLLIPGYQYNGSPFLLSEFGGISYLMPGTQPPPGAWGYSGVEKTANDALARLRSLYEAIAKLPAFAGLCYTQLTDVEQEINGLMTFDRKPKFDVNLLQQINDLVQ